MTENQKLAVLTQTLRDVRLDLIDHTGNPAISSIVDLIVAALATVDADARMITQTEPQA